MLPINKIKKKGALKKIKKKFQKKKKKELKSTPYL